MMSRRENNAPTWAQQHQVCCGRSRIRGLHASTPYEHARTLRRRNNAPTWAHCGPCPVARTRPPRRHNTITSWESVPHAGADHAHLAADTTPPRRPIIEGARSWTQGPHADILQALVLAVETTPPRRLEAGTARTSKPPAQASLELQPSSRTSKPPRRHRQANMSPMGNR